MTRARRTLVSLQDTPYYHCVTRCVRRAFLCGQDRYSGQNYEHRRQWVLDRLRQLAQAFGIDVCAYAIMHNHYHLVVRVNAEQVATWSQVEVLQRWCSIYKGPILVRQYLGGENLLNAQQDTVNEIAEVYRERLASISYYMACLNEHIARKANAEDNCKGRFWEGRFKSQALLDEAALLSCMAYVDLNPVRAGSAKGLDKADFTSVQERLFRLTAAQQHKTMTPQQNMLLPFAESEHSQQIRPVLPLTLKAYIDLVDWTGRVVRNDQRGALPTSAKTAIASLGLSDTQWLSLSLEIQQASLQAIGGVDAVRRYNRNLGKQWLSGQNRLGRVYGGF